MAEKKEFDIVGFIMDFESGNLNEEDVIDGFQKLIDDGLVWKLQGLYGRTAMDLIEHGYCTDKRGLN